MEGEEEWEVKAILAHRYFGHQKKLQYLVKWHGYPDSDNTWEPVENLHANDLIQDYEHHWQGAAQQVVAAIHLQVTKVQEGKWAAQQYQIHTPDQLKQKINQSTDLKHSLLPGCTEYVNRGTEGRWIPGKYRDPLRSD